MKTRKQIQLLLIALFGMTFLFAGNVNAQDEKYGDMERPNNIGVSNFDNFKNSAFDIYYNIGKLDVNLAKVEENLISYKKDADNINYQSLKSDVKSLNEINEAIPKLQSEVKGLKGESETMIKNAKNIKPRTKSPKAVGNTKKAVKALDAANDRAKILVDRQKIALKLATELLGDN